LPGNAVAALVGLVDMEKLFRAPVRGSGVVMLKTEQRTAINRGVER
jgi:hypothetical protein